MKLTSEKIESIISEKKLETQKVEGISEKLKKEADDYISALDGMQDIGENNNTISNLRAEIRSEVEDKKTTEIKDKLSKIGKELESAKKDNNEMIDGLKNNIDKARGIKGEITSGSMESANKAVKQLEKASADRKTMDGKLSDDIAEAEKVKADSDNIKV